MGVMEAVMLIAILWTLFYATFGKKVRIQVRVLNGEDLGTYSFRFMPPQGSVVILPEKRGSRRYETYRVHHQRYSSLRYFEELVVVKDPEA